MSFTTRACGCPRGLYLFKEVIILAPNRDPARKQALDIYIEFNGEILIKDIAKRVAKHTSTLKKWKRLDYWDYVLEHGEEPSEEYKAEQERLYEEAKELDGKVDLTRYDENGVKTHDKRGRKIGHYRRKPKNTAFEGNVAAVRHGFYRDYLPEHLVKIIEETENMTIADRLWFQIETKFATLVHMHNIMFVNTRTDTLTETQSSGTDGTTSKLMYAFEQYAEYVKTEARLTSEWRNVVKQFLELADDDDERRLKLEGMKLNVKKTRLDIKKVKMEIDLMEGNGPQTQESEVAAMLRKMSGDADG